MLNGLQIDNGDTLVDPSYRHKICNLEIVCSVTMLWLGKHIFNGILNTLEHPLMALSTVRTRCFFQCPRLWQQNTVFCFCFYIFLLFFLLHSVIRLDGFSSLHPIVCQRCFCWQRTLFGHLTCRNWILNNKIWINILILTLWSWKKNWTGFLSQFLKSE